MEEILELKHIYYSYHTMDGETPALTDISFSMKEGEFVAVVGPLRLWQIHIAFSDRRTFGTRKRTD